MRGSEWHRARLTEVTSLESSYARIFRDDTAEPTTNVAEDHNDVPHWQALAAAIQVQVERERHAIRRRDVSRDTALERHGAQLERLGVETIPGVSQHHSLETSLHKFGLFQHTCRIRGPARAPLPPHLRRRGRR